MVVRTVIPIADKLHAWLLAQRLRVPDGSGIAKALDYSLKRWAALTRYLDDGAVPIDNNHIEQQIRPIAVGRKNWLFAGSVRAGKRAAAVMSLIQSAKLNGHDPYAYLKDVLTRLPTHPNSRIEEFILLNRQSCSFIIEKLIPKYDSLLHSMKLYYPPTCAQTRF